MTLQSYFLISQLFLSVMLPCIVTALKCTKLVTIEGIPAMMDQQIFTIGLYVVNTTLPTSSTEVRELAALLLQDSNGIKFAKESFTATLQPKHIKKVHYKDEIQHSCMFLHI